MKKETLLLKLAVFIIGLPVVALCVLLAVSIISDPINPSYAHILYPIVIGLFTSAIPFFMALFQALKLLSYIDKNQAFSELSIKALKVIKFCALIISGLYVIILPFAYLLAQLEDAPGIILICMVPVFASIIIAVFAALLQKLLQNAIEIKSENDLTI